MAVLLYNLYERVVLGGALAMLAHSLCTYVTVIDSFYNAIISK